jgi:hypothetical protein
MFYIDDYNSKTITSSPSKKEDVKELTKTKFEMIKQQLAAFWFLAGVTIVDKFKDVKELLSKHGYMVSDQQDAASAIADMVGTAKWTKFVKDFSEIIEDKVDETIVDVDTKEDKEENSFAGLTVAIIGAAGALASGSLGLASSSKHQKAAKESAKAQMFSGIAATIAAKEAAKVERERIASEKQKQIVWIVVSVIIVLGIIIGIIIYKKRKAKAA